MESSTDQVFVNDSSAADIIIIGPPQGGYETDQEEENEENVPDNGLSYEVSSELVVHKKDNDEEINENKEYNNEEEEVIPPKSKGRVYQLVMDNRVMVHVHLKGMQKQRRKEKKGSFEMDQTAYQAAK